MENEYFLMLNHREIGTLTAALLWFKNHFEERIKETGVGKNIPSICNTILTKIRKVNLNEKGRTMEKTLKDCRTERETLEACLSWITKILENNGFFIKQNRREIADKSNYARNLADTCMDIETALFYLRVEESGCGAKSSKPIEE